MTPLVDVMLVLLIIFIITVPTIQHAVRVELPVAEQTPATPPQSVQISIDADGGIYWDAEALSQAQFRARLQSAAAQPQPPELFIRGDRRVPYQHVAQAMAAIQRAGIVKLGFVTEPE